MKTNLLKLEVRKELKQLKRGIYRTQHEEFMLADAVNISEESGGAARLHRVAVNSGVENNKQRLMLRDVKP